MNSSPRKKDSTLLTNHPIKSNNRPPGSLVIPYGTIPKYHKENKKRRRPIASQRQQNNQKPSVRVPYPFFQLALSARPSFLTSLAHKWYLKKNTKTSTSSDSSNSEKSAALSPVGFMPRSFSLPTDTAYLSSVKVTVPMTIHSNHLHNQHEISSSFSSSSNITTSVTSSFSSSAPSLGERRSFNSADLTWASHSDTSPTETHYATSSQYYKTTSTLSGLLCENYVQSQLMLMTMADDDASENPDVENDADGCPVTCPSLTPTSTSSTSGSTSSSTSPTEPFFLDTLIYPSSLSPFTFDNKIFDTTPTDSHSAAPSPAAASNNNDNDESLPIHVPLATFRMFRARDDDENDSSMWDEGEDDTVTNVTTRFGSYDDDHPFQPYDEKNTRPLAHVDESDGDNDDDVTVSSGKEALLENSWANWEKAWQGKQWVLSMSEQDEKKDDCLPHQQSKPATAAHSPSPLPALTLLKSREPRVNSAHLRQLVAEVNMMRADKIIGPLRPRNYLPKRNDPLPCHTPSPLSTHFVFE